MKQFPAQFCQLKQIDPRQDLVYRLLMYKQFKDAAILLEEKSSHWQSRYGRIDRVFRFGLRQLNSEK